MKTMNASELRPGDLFAYTVLSTAGDYERHARMLEGGRMRLTETGEEFEMKNPAAPVRLIRRNDLAESAPEMYDVIREIFERWENGAVLRQGCDLHLKLRGVMMKAEGK